MWYTNAPSDISESILYYFAWLCLSIWLFNIIEDDFLCHVFKGGGGEVSYPVGGGRENKKTAGTQHYPV